MTRQGLKFLLRITDYFDGHWEDPDWGQQPVNQVLVMVSALTLVDGIEDESTRNAVQQPLERAIAGAAMRIARERHG